MRSTIEGMSKQMAELGEIIGKLKKKIEYLKIAGGTASLVQVLSAHLHNKRKITKKKKTVMKKTSLKLKKVLT